MDHGILIIMVQVSLHCQNESLRQFVQDEFVDRVEEQDIEYHFAHNHSHYEAVLPLDKSIKVVIGNHLIGSPESRQIIDDFL